MLRYAFNFSETETKNSMASSLVKRFISQTSSVTKVGIRHEGIFTKYREPPNGFLFNRKPLKPGEKREWESWQPIWYGGWTIATLIFCVGSYYRPDESILAWGRREAFKRIAEIEAENEE